MFEAARVDSPEARTDVHRSRRDCPNHPFADPPMDRWAMVMASLRDAMETWVTTWNCRV